MESQAGLIIGGRLLPDPIGRRVGEPDLLVRTDGISGYRAIDIKHHRTLDADPAGLPAVCSGLDFLTLEAASEDADRSARKRKGDLLQLAHYQRMLDATGQAIPDGRYGGIIGVEGLVTWYDLDAPDLAHAIVVGSPEAAGRQWRSTTSSSTSDWTSSPSQLSTSPTRQSSRSLCPYESVNAPSARGGRGVDRSSGPAPAT